MLRRAICAVVPLLIGGCCARKEHAHDHEGHHDHHGDQAGHAAHQMPHRFENADHWSRVFDDPTRDQWQKPEEVVAKMDLKPGLTVADIGAGTGYFLRHLSPAVGADGKVLALDVEEDMIRFMRERVAREQLPNVEARVVPTDDPQLAPGSVDRILIVDTWHHIADRASYSKKLAQALKPGGKVFVVDFTMETDKGPPRPHRLTPEAVIAELRSGGLSGVVIEESLPDQYIVAAGVLEDRGATRP
jgi:cyclopropane fatty-acyl-phospholipid synthase-like methyltransferase